MKPNVLLVVLDSVRAKNTSIHDYVRDTTPFLSALSKQATVYEQARASGQWSLPSHTSMFTGYHVDEHRITSPHHGLESGHSIWETLAEEGYDTGMFSSQRFLTDPAFGLTSGFDTVRTTDSLLPFPEAVTPSDVAGDAGDSSGGDDRSVYRRYLTESVTSRSPYESLVNGLSSKLSETTADVLLPERAKRRTFADEFLDWERRTTGPWAACINFMDAHFPYAPGTDHDRWGDRYLRRLQSRVDHDYAYHGGAAHWSERRALENLYDGAIRKLDSYVERVVRSLRDRGVLDDTLVVVTADHGEGFGTQSNVRPRNRICAHNFGLHEVLLHVPLLVLAPGQSEPERIAAPASLTEFPNVVESVVETGGSPADFVPGGNVLASAHHTRVREVEDQIRAYCDDVDRFAGHAQAVYSRTDEGIEKYLSWGSDSATVRPHDARTTEKVSDEIPPEVDSLVSVPNRDLRAADAGEMDRGTEARLADLGYL